MNSIEQEFTNVVREHKGTIPSAGSISIILGMGRLVHKKRNQNTEADSLDKA